MTPGSIFILSLLSLTALVACDMSIENIIRNQGSKLLSRLRGPEIKAEESGCECIYEKYDCGCCADLQVERLGLNDTACVNVTYLPDQYGISLLLIWDDEIMFNETVSARNPPPVCVGIPYVKMLDACVLFYDLDLKNSTFHGCVKLEADVYHYDIEDFDLGCFNIPFYKKPRHFSARAQRQKHKEAVSLVKLEIN